MQNYPEFGRLDSLDIYADDFTDGKSMFHCVFFIVNAVWVNVHCFSFFSVESSSCSSKNGLCSTFCFPTPTGRTCGCQDKVNLQSDQLTCQRGNVLCRNN